MKKCATCFHDPVTDRWHNPTGEKIRGTSKSNWVCNKCRNKPQNRHWNCTPAREIYGTEHEDALDVHPEPESKQGHYETPLCIEIMRRYCYGVSQRTIAGELETSLSYVIATIAYWKTNYGYFVSRVKKILDRDEDERG